MLQRPTEVLVGPAAWDQLEHGLHDPVLRDLAESAFANGTAFAEHGVSIETVRQQGGPGEGDLAKLIVVTHRATDAALAATVDALRGLDAVDDVASVMRVEGS